MMEYKSHNKTGFKVPDGYFETLETRLIHLVENENQAGFKVPQDYFENLEERILLNVKPASRVFTLQRDSIKWLSPLLAAAAIITAILTTSTFFKAAPQDNSMQLATIKNDELMDYLLKQPQIDDTYTLSYLFATTQLPENDGLTQTLEDDELIEYLMHNNIDLPYTD